MMLNHVNLDQFKALGEELAKNRAGALDNFHIKLNWKEGFRSEVTVRDFAPFTVDEPEVLGAQNKGPNPVEYLLAGCMGCFTVGVVAGATKAGIQINSLQVEIDANVDMAVFYDQVLGGQHGITQPYIILTIDADAPLEMLEALAEDSLRLSPVLNSLKQWPVKIIVEKV